MKHTVHMAMEFKQAWPGHSGVTWSNIHCKGWPEKGGGRPTYVWSSDWAGGWAEECWPDWCPPCWPVEPSPSCQAEMMKIYSSQFPTYAIINQWGGALWTCCVALFPGQEWCLLSSLPQQPSTTDNVGSTVHCTALYCAVLAVLAVLYTLSLYILY